MDAHSTGVIRAAVAIAAYMLYRCQLSQPLIDRGIGIEGHAGDGYLLLVGQALAEKGYVLKDGVLVKRNPCWKRRVR